MERIESVDYFRLIAIVAVIAIHTSPFHVDVDGENEAYMYRHDYQSTLKVCRSVFLCHFWLFLGAKGSEK